MGNEYFSNEVEGQNKATEWKNYIFTNPLASKK